jgi:hypothetical protein
LRTQSVIKCARSLQVKGPSLAARDARNFNR